ncbi:MAG: hypothetical protein NDJ24_08660 [Alphaproteobacteria bacterium]|nr:hypothetical protein [Alphaproteobacteria bacterium]
MIQSLILTRDFERAAADYRQQMAVLAQASDPLFAAPGFYKGDWRARDDNNCYNFALHRPTRDYLQPGELSGAWQWASTDLAADTHNAAQADGLLYLGQSFLQCRPDHFPVALFFEDEEFGDYHWLALRQQVKDNNPTGRLIWCHKPDGDHAPEIITAPETIFSKAHAYGYPVFAGYYQVSRDMAYREAVRPAP